MDDHVRNDREALLQNEFVNNSLLTGRSIETTVSTEVSTSVEANSHFTRYSVEQSVEEPEEVIILYKRRWYVLIMFALVSATQGGGLCNLLFISYAYIL